MIQFRGNFIGWQYENTMKQSWKICYHPWNVKIHWLWIFSLNFFLHCFVLRCAFMPTTQHHGVLSGSDHEVGRSWHACLNSQLYRMSSYVVIAMYNLAILYLIRLVSSCCLHCYNSSASFLHIVLLNHKKYPQAKVGILYIWILSCHAGAINIFSCNCHRNEGGSIQAT